jgi:hypothetical protein
MLSFHELAFQTLFAQLEDTAQSQAVIPLESPGLKIERTVKAIDYVYWRRTRAGRREEELIGRADAPTTADKLADLESIQIEQKALMYRSSQLRKAGFAAADNSAALTIASIYNAGIFEHGGVLVGTHAYGTLLNSLGIRSPKNYLTADVDIGTPQGITVAIPENKSFLEVLRNSGLHFLEVPRLDPRKHATSFKVRGTDLKVDLLVAGNDTYASKPIPALKAHAMGLPYFQYLMAEKLPGIVLGRDHVVPVKVPNPARFAIHKLIVSTLRSNTSALKDEKDLHQAATLIHAVLQKHPTDLDDAAAALDSKGRKRAASAAVNALAAKLDISPEVEDFLANLAG